MNFVYKLGSVFLVLVSVVILISAIIYIAPVDPARLTFGQRSDAEAVARKQKELHLDKPLFIQLGYYLNDISYLRSSFQSGKPVSSLLMEAIPKTLVLALTAIFIAFLFGCTLGVFAALYKDTWIDRSIISFTVLGISVPSYVSAIVLALIFGYILKSYTGLNIQGSIIDLDDLGNERIYWKNLILPAIALGIRPLSIITQLMRSSLLDVLNMDYLRTAQSKGLSFIAAIKKHAVRNSLNPVLTAATGWFASLLAGAFFVEQVFNFKGVGELTVNALINYDIPVILGCTLFISFIFIIINMSMDTLYRLIDPKMRK